jgi:hypothetical protein
VKIFKKLGIDKTFVQEAMNKYGGYGKMLGLSPDKINRALAQLDGAMDDETPVQRKDSIKAENSKFNKSKYIKV